MNKIIALALLVPSMVFASSVAINEVNVTGNSFTGSGSASFTGEDTLSVLLDNVVLVSDSTNTNWLVSGTASNGSHTLTANVGSASASVSFVAGYGGGLSPCQIDGTCPHFGFFAPSVYMEDLGSVPTWRYVAPGVDGCPAFFTMNCLIK